MFKSNNTPVVVVAVVEVLVFYFDSWCRLKSRANLRDLFWKDLIERWRGERFKEFKAFKFIPSLINLTAIYALYALPYPN
jgi:hypothetical protein